jgi:hypothetical protein
MPQYEVIVGNVGCVHRGKKLHEADAVFDEYCIHSLAGGGRAGREDVTQFEDGEIRKELNNVDELLATVEQFPWEYAGLGVWRKKGNYDTRVDSKMIMPLFLHWLMQSEANTGLEKE